ncbi:MAG: VanW family protein [Polyangiaceae bacterium]
MVLGKADPHSKRQQSDSDWALSSRKPPRRSRRRWLLPGFMVALVAGVTGGSTYAFYHYLPPGRSIPGTYVGGRLQPEDKQLRLWLEERRAQLLARPVYLEIDGEVFQRRLGALGVELDVGQNQSKVREHAEQGSISERIYKVVSAKRGEQDIPLVWSFDERKLEVALEDLSPEVFRDPVDARLDLVGHQKIHDTPGRSLDVRRTVESIAAGQEFDENQILELKVKSTPPQVSLDMLADIDVSKVLGEFQTKFAGTGEGRSVNIARGAELLNGVVIAPGQTLSFNERVGDRTLARGFTWAPVILDDELTPGVGGGTCQVASTLHAAAVYGALDVVDRRSHSRPSGYAPMGLDATVVFGEVDLKIRNPYDSPIIVHAFIPSPGFLKVELLGRDAPKVEYKYGVSRAYDFYRRITTKPWIKPGKRLMRQRGHKGYDVVSWVKVTRPDGTKAERSYNSSYRPVPEVFWVGPGYDLDELPELPDGAKDVQVDGRSLPNELFSSSPFEEPPSG